MSPRRPVPLTMKAPREHRSCSYPHQSQSTSISSSVHLLALGAVLGRVDAVVLVAVRASRVSSDPRALRAQLVEERGENVEEMLT